MNEAKRDVRVAVDNENYLILAGDPTMEDKDTNNEILDLIKKGFTIKTIPYSEFQKLKWIYDKPGYVPYNQKVK